MVKSKLGYIGLVLMWVCAVRAQVGVESLPELHTGTIGTKTELISEIWGKNPDPTELITQIQNLANAPLNDEERYWLKQILLTDAGGIETLEKEQEAFLKARLDTLMAQGLFDEVIRLTDQIESKNQTPMTRQYRITAQFAKGNIQEACQDEALSAFGEEEPFVRVACAWEQKTPDEVALAYDVYQESPHADHPFLTVAGDALYLEKQTAFPKGLPSVWEMPFLAANRPNDVMTLPLTRGLLMVINTHMSVPIGLRDQAFVKLNGRVRQEIDGIELLKRLKSVAEARRLWEEGRPGD